jgi:ribose transport system ATP-binding protein
VISAFTLELRDIVKVFPGVRALDGVSMEIRGGEVHMLLGENGAGKSSLMKVLCGAYRADEGQIFVDGQPLAVHGPADAARAGIAVIFQEFSLVPHLDIAQNLFLGREPRGALPGLVDEARMHREARAMLDMLEVDVDTRTHIADLGVARQQMVEIAKALSRNARVVVMDEPTSALSDRESEQLFKVIARLKAEGVAIVYISHRMNEVFALGDRITVLRDGKRIASLPASEAQPDELIGMMVGRSVDMAYPRNRVREPGEVALQVSALHTPSGLVDVNLHVRSGEIVGLAGLVGSGRTEVARAVFGADAVGAGEIRIFGQESSGGPEKVARLGVALIPESRKTEGLALHRSVQDNVLVAGLSRLFPRGWFDAGKARGIASGLIERMQVATAGLGLKVKALSGGNQQKIVLGKWLATECKLFIFDEPTRGIDVGAKAEIFALIDRLVAEGAAVLLISSELPEIVNVCDRVYVMKERRVAGELAGEGISQANVVRLAMYGAQA